VNHINFELVKRSGYLLYQVQHSLDHALGVALAPFDLSPLQFNGLANVNNEPGISAAEIARRNSVTPQSVQTALKPLIERGIIERRPHPVHGRVLGIYPLAAADQLVVDAGNAIDTVEKNLVAGLTDTEAAQFHDLLLAMLQHLNPQALDRSSLRPR